MRFKPLDVLVGVLIWVAIGSALAMLLGSLGRLALIHIVVVYAVGLAIAVIVVHTRASRGTSTSRRVAKAGRRSGARGPAARSRLAPRRHGED